MNNKTVSALFNKFAGREVPMKEWSTTIGGVDYIGLKPVTNPDPTIEEMNKVAQANGLQLMLWTPNMAKADFQAFVTPNSVNVHIKKEADGKYRVSNKFTLG